MLRRRGSNKRGFAIQFNWLFVLIGGAIILGFFFSLIANQASEEEKRTAQESTHELDALLKVSLAARDTQKAVLFDKKILFSCDEISEYYIEGAFKHSRYDYNVLFSPNELESREVIVQTLVFEAPFRTLPVVYVTNKDIEYVFVGNQAMINRIYYLMPENTTRRVIPSGNLENYPNNNHDHTVFVLHKNDEHHLNKLNNFVKDNNKAYAVVIEPGEGDLAEFGELNFYSHNPTTGFVNEGDSLYLDLKIIFGGVISHDRVLYECNFKKVLQRLELLSILHKERMVYYGIHSPEKCQSNYAVAETYFEEIGQYAGKEEASVDDFRNLMTTINDLKALQRYLITQTECPYIY